MVIIQWMWYLCKIDAPRNCFVGIRCPRSSTGFISHIIQERSRYRPGLDALNPWVKQDKAEVLQEPLFAQGNKEESTPYGQPK